MSDDDSLPEKGSGRLPVGVVVALVALAALLVTGALAEFVGGTPARVLFLLSQVVVISIIIWQACDPFAEAAQWIGTTLRIPGSVRGATLDAIASSMPELFSGIFFVVVAVFAAGDAPELLAEASGEGFGATVATCAGSAIYNMILIPAICALFISFHRPERPTIDVDDKVISRDGLWFVGCEIVLLVFLFQDRMVWWMGLVLLALYGVYLYQLFSDARIYQRKYHAIREALEAGRSRDEIVAGAEARHERISRDLVARVERELERGEVSEDEEPPPETAEVLFGLFEVHLSHSGAWLVVGAATLVAAAACYWLVEVTRAAADVLGVPIFFVAVILAAAASSVPDTFLSVGAARRGDDDGAVSNAFGSNIFDICICLTLPLLVGSYLTGWQPIELTQNGEPMPGLVGLRLLLCILTVVTLLIMWHNRQLTRNKAWVLCGLYGIFVAYAVAGSLGLEL